MNKKVIILVSFIAAAVSLYFLTSSSKLPDGCTQEDAGLYFQPQGKYEIDHYIISCGTDNVVTHISVQRAGSKRPNDVVVINGHHRDLINIIWLDAKNIKIDYQGEDNQTTKYQNKHKDINIQLTHKGEPVSTR